MLKFVLVGCGRIATKKHTEAFINNKDYISLEAVCDIQKEKAENLANIIEENGLKRPKIYTDYTKMAEIEFDAAVIATESGKHYEISKFFLDNSKHVLTEKPMALNTKHMDDMIKTAEEKNVNLGVCFQNRFNPPIQELRKKIESNDIGNIYHGQASIRWNRNEGYYKQAPWRGTWEQDGGTLMNQCTHNIDLLIWNMNSEIEQVYGQINNFNHPYIQAEDFGSAIIKFKNGALGIIEGTANTYPKNLEETLSVFGEKGTVVIGGLAVNKIETWNIQQETEHPFQTLPDPETVYGAGHTPLYKDFHDSIIEGRKPYVDGKEGKKAVEVVLAIYKSTKENKPIKFPFEFSTEDMKEFFGR